MLPRQVEVDEKRPPSITFTYEAPPRMFFEQLEYVYQVEEAAHAPVSEEMEEEDLTLDQELGGEESK